MDRLSPHHTEVLSLLRNPELTRIQKVEILIKRCLVGQDGTDDDPLLGLFPDNLQEWLKRNYDSLHKVATQDRSKRHTDLQYLLQDTARFNRCSAIQRAVALTKTNYFMDELLVTETALRTLYLEAAEKSEMPALPVSIEQQIGNVSLVQMCEVCEPPAA